MNTDQRKQQMEKEWGNRELFFIMVGSGFVLAGYGLGFYVTKEMIQLRFFSVSGVYLIVLALLLCLVGFCHLESSWHWINHKIEQWF